MATDTAVTQVTPLGQAMRRLCITKLAVIANKRAERVATQEHISRWNEMHEIAAECHNADPHGDLSWREDMELPY